MFAPYCQSEGLLWRQAKWTYLKACLVSDAEH